jgi:hypothetical protein
VGVGVVGSAGRPPAERSFSLPTSAKLVDT